MKKKHCFNQPSHAKTLLTERNTFLLKIYSPICIYRETASNKKTNDEILTRRNRRKENLFTQSRKSVHAHLLYFISLTYECDGKETNRSTVLKRFLLPFEEN